METLDLERGIPGVGLVRGRKVGENPFHHQMFGGVGRVEQGRGVFPPHPNPPHPGVDLEVHPSQETGCRRRRLDRADLVDRRRAQLQVVLEEQGDLVVEQAPGHQDREPDPGLAKREALLQVGDAQDLRPDRLEAPPHRNKAVSIGIRLEDRHDASGRRGGIQNCKIVSNRR